MSHVIARIIGWTHHGHVVRVDGDRPPNRIEMHDPMPIPVDYRPLESAIEVECTHSVYERVLVRGDDGLYYAHESARPLEGEYLHEWTDRANREWSRP